MASHRHDGKVLASAEHVRVRLGGRLVLDNVGVEVRGNEVVTLIGPNGSGKTTLVRVLLGLLRPDAGAVSLEPRLRIGYMPQRLHVDPALPLTVRRFLDLGLHGRNDRQRLDEVLGEVGAGHVLDAPFQSVSGGEAQRVMLARALLRDPDLLVLDEPVQGVDVAGQAELYRLIAGIRERRGCGVLMVSHDLHLVMAATDHVVCLNTHVCCAGHPESVSRDPAFVGLFGSQVASSLAVYHHHHDHRHALDGHVVPLPQPGDRREAAGDG